MPEPAGWYPDPDERPDTYRWWTGVGWTRWLADSEDGPPPVGHDDPRVTAAVIPQGDRQVSHTARTIVVGLIIVLGVLAVASIGGMISNRATVPPGAAATPTDLGQTPEMAVDDYTFDPETRQASMGSVSVTLPEGRIGREGVRGVVDPATGSSIDVEPNEEGNWIASVIFAQYAGQPQASNEAVAETLLGFWATGTYGEAEVEITNVRPGDRGELPESSAVLLADITYSIPGLAATSDAVEIVVIDVTAAQKVVFVSAVPNTASDEVVAAVAESRASLRVG